MKLLTLAALTLLSSSALAMEVVIFDRKFSPPGSCTLVAPHEGYDLKAYAFCVNSELHIDIYMDNMCNYQQFFDKVNLEDEEITEDITIEKTRFISFSLRNPISYDPVFAKVIRDRQNCVIATSASNEILDDALRELWHREAD
ncbi:MAG: hypothetical protein AAF662_16775 [Pseudomonadota bacterium]